MIPDRLQDFLDDLGTSEMLSKPGPVDFLTITKMTQTIQ